MIYSCALILILFFLPGGLVAPTWRTIRTALTARRMPAGLPASHKRST
jgi:hypothetical protein